MIRILVCVLAGAALLPAGDTDDVEKAERSWGVMAKAGDVAGLGTLMGDSLVYTHSNGRVDNKQSYLKSLSGGLKYEVADYEEVKVRLYGKLAIVHSLVRIRSVSDGSVYDGKLRLLRIYEKGRSGWQMIAHQSTRVAS
jgi:ketosteroid isomerase-like protein